MFLYEEFCVLGCIYMCVFVFKSVVCKSLWEFKYSSIRFSSY